MWQVTGDTWHLTPDMWYVTGDRWQVTHGVRWTLSQNFSFLALTVWDLWGFEDLEEKDSELIYQSITKLYVEKPGYTGSGKYLESSNVPRLRSTCIYIIGSWSVKFVVLFFYILFCIRTTICTCQEIQCPPYERLLSKIDFSRSLRRRHFFKRGARK